MDGLMEWQGWGDMPAAIWLDEEKCKAGTCTCAIHVTWRIYSPEIMCYPIEAGDGLR